MRLTTEQTLARAMSEDELLSRVMDLLALYGFLAHHARNSKAGVTQGDVGFPDILAVGHGHILAIELKRELGKATAAQWTWLTRLDIAGAEAYVFKPSHYLSGRIGTVLGEMK